MQNYKVIIEEAWQNSENLMQSSENLEKVKQIIDIIINEMDLGKIRTCVKISNKWIVNEWVKKAILLYFKFNHSKIYSNGYMNWFDKIPPKYNEAVNNEDFKTFGNRIVPGSFVRFGSYIAKNVIIMPSFVNIGAYIDEGTMIDTWASIGSCAQIGKNCHISGGTGIGGVLEPIQSQPVIIEDNCFIGARSEIVEGVIVEEGAVISMGVFIGSSTKIINRDSGEITYGRIPPYSVVVPGNLPPSGSQKVGLYCAVIIKQVDESTRKKTSINELLRC